MIVLGDKDIEDVFWGKVGPDRKLGREGWATEEVYKGEPPFFSPRYLQSSSTPSLSLPNPHYK